MSAIAAVRAGLRAAIEARPELMRTLNGVHDTRPARATPPWLELGEAREIDWSAKAMRGREIRIVLIVRDEGVSGARAERLIGLAGDAAEAMAAALEGWRVASLAPLSLRSGRGRGGDWVASLELRIRVAAAD